jgi:hypothetical protein
MNRVKMLSAIALSALALGWFARAQTAPEDEGDRRAGDCETEVGDPPTSTERFVREYAPDAEVYPYSAD